ncbi:unnamed protein product [Brassica rapa subsp. narinosa]
MTSGNLLSVNMRKHQEDVLNTSMRNVLEVILDMKSTP